MPREVYSLLAQANLLRMRGCWEEAVSNCMAALRLAPDSSSAQSLLGDIYENQGRVDDAVQWYRMALDASPDSPADRLKLDRLLQRQPGGSRPESSLAKAQEIFDTSVEAPVNSPLSARPSWPWMPRGHWEPHHSEAVLRYVALSAALIVLLIVAFAYASVHRHAALASLGLAPEQEVKTSPVVVPPATNVADSTGTSGFIPRDAAEQSILVSLGSSGELKALGITVWDLQSDPRAGRLTITIALSPDLTLTRTAISRSSFHAVQAAAAASPSTGLFTIRLLLGPVGGASSSSASLVFVADASRAALPGNLTSEPDDQSLQAFFTNVWWSPQITS